MTAPSDGGPSDSGPSDSGPPNRALALPAESGTGERAAGGEGARDAAPSGAADPAIRDFSRSLPMALLRVREAVMDRFRPMLRAHGVTEQQWRVLRALAAGPAGISSLAARCCILGPSLTRILKNLEGRGLVSRSGRAADGRVSVIAITPAGTRLIDQVGPHSEAHYAAIAAAVGVENIDALYRLLGEVEARLR